MIFFARNVSAQKDVSNQFLFQLRLFFFKMNASKTRISERISRPRKHTLCCHPRQCCTSWCSPAVRLYRLPVYCTPIHHEVAKPGVTCLSLNIGKVRRAKRAKKEFQSFSAGGRKVLFCPIPFRTGQNSSNALKTHSNSIKTNESSVLPKV